MGVTRVDDWATTPYDAIIDVRSPAEFADDHIPGALSLPALSNEERVKVGTLYKQVSAFEAKKLGAALISRNIATHIETFFLDKPGGFKPLIYCWRGGQRSGSFSMVLAEIGFLPQTLIGGYKRYRRDVLNHVEVLPPQYRYCVVSGQTATAKTRFLDALRDAGGQVLDLEGLANHKGSLFGLTPGTSQPSPRAFDSRIVDALRAFDPSQTVWVESESPKIGQLYVPKSLHNAMQNSPSVRLTAPLAARVQHSVDDYRPWFDHPDEVCSRLERLTYRHGHDVINRWIALVKAGDWDELVKTLLVDHYDPAYAGSASAYGWDAGTPVVMDDLQPETIRKAAEDLLRRFP